MAAKWLLLAAAAFAFVPSYNGSSVAAAAQVHVSLHSESHRGGGRRSAARSIYEGESEAEDEAPSFDDDDDDLEPVPSEHVEVMTSDHELPSSPRDAMEATSTDGPVDMDVEYTLESQPPEADDIDGVMDAANGARTAAESLKEGFKTFKKALRGKGFASPIEDAGPEASSRASVENHHESVHGPSNKSASVSRNGSSDSIRPADLGLSTAEDPLTNEMEQEITDLVMGNSAEGKISATAMSSGINMIRALIKDRLMPKISAAHKADQNELNSLMKAVNKCATQKKNSFTGVAKMFRVYRKMSPLHKSCRGMEAVLVTQMAACRKELQDKQQIKKLKCKDFALASKLVGDENAMRQVVKKGGSERVDVYIKRVTATICGTNGNGMIAKYSKARAKCMKATKEHKDLKKKCAKVMKDYKHKKIECNQIQDKMDHAACQRATLVKDACEGYAECHRSKLKAYLTAYKTVQIGEKDRKAEWRALMRMKCLADSFGGGGVTMAEVSKCKKATHDTNHLVISYPKIPKIRTCTLPNHFPYTASYKKAEFSNLPALAKGRVDANACVGVQEINTKPARGSPKTCKCKRLTFNGPYSAGPVVKCENCLEVRRSNDKTSCPAGTKLFAPRTRLDWKTFIRTANPLRAPHWIVDISRPQNGCGGCTKQPMNSKSKMQKTWRTQDNSPWWLRSSKYNEPNGDYHANCYLDLWQTPKNENSITYNDGSCNYHSKSYYCQPIAISTKPKKGSPGSCHCTKIELTGRYSADTLLMCKSCLDVRKTTQRNSCPQGTKIFAPASRKDWKTFVGSAKPLRAPHWIVDITRPSNGCGGCTRHVMNSKNANQATWKTSDGAPWWLRSTRYNEPNGDYKANCYLDLWRTPSSEDSVTFNDGSCNYHSNSYYCQPLAKRRKR